MIEENKDLKLFGIVSRYTSPLSLREISKITGTCFGGLGMYSCVPASYTTEDPYNYNLPYYNNLGNLKGQVYCVQCCGSDPSLTDVWDMRCPMNAEWEGLLQSILYIGAEFRLAKMRYMNDRDFVSCPLRSTSCTYAANGTTLSCDLNDPNPTYIVGYELNIYVEQYDSDFSYWRGVSSCNVTTYTRSTPLTVGETFREKITMIHVPTQQPIDFGKAMVIVSLILFVIAVLLYFCRRESCIVCQRKLVICFDRCVICRMFGAYMPDPVLLRALEEKGDIIQAAPLKPGRFPGSYCMVGTCRGLLRCGWNVCCCGYCKRRRKVAAVVGGEEPLRAESPNIFHRLSKKADGGWADSMEAWGLEGPDLGTHAICGCDRLVECLMVFCCCCSCCIQCCCVRKNKKKEKKKLQVITLPVAPHVIYEAIHHPIPPTDIVKAQREAEAVFRKEEDIELYGEEVGPGEMSNKLGRADAEAGRVEGLSPLSRSRKAGSRKEKGKKGKGKMAIQGGSGSGSGSGSRPVSKGEGERPSSGGFLALVGLGSREKPGTAESTTVGGEMVVHNSKPSTPLSPQQPPVPAAPKSFFGLSSGHLLQFSPFSKRNVLDSQEGGDSTMPPSTPPEGTKAWYRALSFAMPVSKRALVAHSSGEGETEDNSEEDGILQGSRSKTPSPPTGPGVAGGRPGGGLGGIGKQVSTHFNTLANSMQGTRKPPGMLQRQASEFDISKMKFYAYEDNPDDPDYEEKKPPPAPLRRNPSFWTAPIRSVNSNSYDEHNINQRSEVISYDAEFV